jgi:hypothetical protein
VNTQKVVGKVGKFNICFRPERLTSHAGTVLLHDFAQRLGVEELLDEELSVKTRERGYSEGQAIGGLVYNLILGGEHLRDLEVLRGDPGTQELLDAEAVLAPTTAGEFLRKFDIGDVSDLQRVYLRLQARVRPHQRTTTCTRFCRKVASNTLLSTISGIFRARTFHYMVESVNFATERAACNGSAPAGASPATVLPQEGCVVIPDSGSR